jgi:hypothetical protein
MGAIVRPDMLKGVLSSKLSAATTQLLELREAEQPRLTPHLSPHQIVDAFLLHARGVYPIVDAFGKLHAGDLVYKAWHEAWRSSLTKADLALWDRLRDDGTQREHAHRAELIEDEIAATADPSVAQSTSGAHGNVHKLRVRFPFDPNRAASEVCADYLRLARRFANDFVREHEQLLR